MFCFSSACVVDTNGKFAAGVNDAGGFNLGYINIKMYVRAPNMFKKTGSVVGHVIGKEDDLWRGGGGGEGGVSKAEDGGSSTPLGLYPCQLVYPQLQKGERQKRGDFLILLCELNNISRIIFTTMHKK
jgi:hypothetical protein